MKKTTKRCIKILYAILTLTIILATLNPVFAVLTPDQIKPSTDTATDSSVQTIAGKLFGLVQTIGVAVSVVVLVVIGVKYLVGSAEEKAEYKKTMLPYVVGAALIGLAPTIAKAVYSTFKTATGS